MRGASFPERFNEGPVRSMAMEERRSPGVLMASE